MIFEEKTIILKDGRTAILKSPCVEDAEKLLNYIKKSCSETDFLARYSEEWTTTIGQEEAWVNRLRSAPDTLGITCYVDGEDAGNCEISFRGDMKVSHRATIANAILKDYWNLGIGSAMFEELVSAAQNRGTEIMELEFIEGNDRARHLYEKFGFRVVCERPNMFKLPVLMCSQKTMDIRDMPGATWRDVVAAVLEECNKAVSLAYLYEQIEPHKKARANQWWKEKIRQTLQCNPEHFDHVGRGLWCIRKSA